MTAIKKTLELARKLTESGVLKIGSGQRINAALQPLSKYNKYGLLTDDLLLEKNPTVKEALRRLPPDVYQERIYRLTKAIAVSTNKSVLPKDEWITVEQDVSYLKPYVQQVLAEQKEKEDWEKGLIQ